MRKRGTLKRILSNYCNSRRLGTKLTGLFGALAIFILIISMLIGGYTSRRYRQSVYKVSMENTSYVLSEFDMRLDRLMHIADILSIDSSIQGNLITMRETNDFVEKSSRKQSISRILNKFLGMEQGISSMCLVVSGNDLRIPVGNYNSMSSDFVYTISRFMQSENERSTWGVDSATGKLYYIREIPRMEYLKLDTLATLYIEIDINEILEDLGERFDISNLQFELFQGSERLFSNINLDSDDNNLIHSKLMYQNYVVLSLLGNRYLVSDLMLTNSNLNAVYYENVDYLSSDMYRMQLIGGILLVSCVLFALLIMHLSVRSIIGHLHKLEDKMTMFQNGEMDTSKYISYKGRQDEIGSIHNQFDDMVEKYDRIIKDNYLKQIAIKDTTIRMLTQQINPHFLYNTLDSIHWLAKCNGMNDVSEMAYSLAFLFRKTIASKDACVRLEDELLFLDHYIKIQSIRFGSRMQFERDVDDSLMSVMVPKFSIQPLVENAIKYALEVNDEVCVIEVKGYRVSRNDIRLSVINSGSSFDSEVMENIKINMADRDGKGIGLRNIDSRLKLMFGSEYGLEFSNENDMAVVSFNVPFDVEKE